jgi:hypothetical protein
MSEQAKAAGTHSADELSPAENWILIRKQIVDPALTGILMDLLTWALLSFWILCFGLFVFLLWLGPGSGGRHDRH